MDTFEDTTFSIVDNTDNLPIEISKIIRPHIEIVPDPVLEIKDCKIKINNCKEIFINNMNMLKQIKKLENKIAKLEKEVEEIKYMPGGPVYQEAKVDFEERAANNSSS